MLAFDDEMFKAELLFSEPNYSSASCDLGPSPNPEAVMDLDELLLSSGFDLIDSHFQAAATVSSDVGVDQEDSDGELAHLQAGYDPHRTDLRPANDGNEQMSTGRSVSEELFPVNTDEYSNRRSDHDYDFRSSADEDEDDDDQDVVPQDRIMRLATRSSGAYGKSSAAAMESSGKRTGLRPQPVRKRCFSTSSVDSNTSPVTTRTPTAKKRKLSGSGSTISRNGPQCMSRNAIAARENRERKKAQFRELEDKVDRLVEENDRLKQDNECMTQTVTTLLAELKYLKGVVSNAPEIASLIQSIRKAPGIKSVATSLGSNLRSQTRGKKVQDENETPATSGKSRLKIPVPTATSGKASNDKSGICLHVLNGSVSVEFCAHCSRTAARTLSK